MLRGTGLRKLIDGPLHFGRWLWEDWSRNPRFAQYSRRQNHMNQSFTNDRRDPHQDREEQLLQARIIPKIIWIYWAQGEADAPHLVCRCMESWRSQNPAWDVRILDADAAGELVDLSDVPEFLPRRFRANVLRLRLLAKFGGVWTDATTYCHRPLDDWLPLPAVSGFFVFSDPGPDRWFDNWFIAAAPEHPLAVGWEAAYTDYITGVKRQPNAYFMMIYALQWHILNDPAARTAWAHCGRLPAEPTFYLGMGLSGQIPLSAAREQVALGLPLSKLTWKVDIDSAQIDAVLDELSSIAQTASNT